MKLDETDKKLINLLQANARLTTKQLAAELKLTTTPVHERIKRLEREGVITHYAARINRVKVDKSLEVFCAVNLIEHQKQHLAAFEAAVAKVPEIVECAHISGDHDYLLKIFLGSMDEYRQFLRSKLSALPAVGKVQSWFVMYEVKSNDAILL